MPELKQQNDHLPKVYQSKPENYSDSLGQCDCGACVVPGWWNIHKPLTPLMLSDREALNTKKLIFNEQTINGFIDPSHIFLFHPTQGNFLVLNDNGYELLQNIPQAQMFPHNSGIPSAIVQQFFTLLYASGFLLKKEQNFSIYQGADHVDTLIVWLHLTNQCNLACPYCYVNKSHQQMSECTAKQTLKSVFKEIHSKKYKNLRLKYAGGEPTLVPDTLIRTHLFAEKLAATQGIHIQGIILTNGVNIPKKLIDFSKKYNIRWAVSLDSLHDPYTPQVLIFLDKIQQYALSIQVTITLTRENINELPEIVEFLMDRKLRFNINFYRQNGEYIKENNLRPENYELVDTLHKTYKVIEKNLPEYSLFSSILDRVDLRTPHKYPCVAGYHYMTINHHGNIVPCQMLVSQRQTEQQFYNPPVSEKNECSECSWRYYCAGGCSIDAFYTAGSYTARSPYCQVYRMFAPKVLRLEALRLLKYSQPLDWNTLQFNA